MRGGGKLRPPRPSAPLSSRAPPPGRVWVGCASPPPRKRGAPSPGVERAAPACPLPTGGLPAPGREATPPARLPRLLCTCAARRQPPPPHSPPLDGGHRELPPSPPRSARASLAPGPRSPPPRSFGPSPRAPRRPSARAPRGQRLPRGGFQPRRHARPRRLPTSSRPPGPVGAPAVRLPRRGVETEALHVSAGEGRVPEGAEPGQGSRRAAARVASRPSPLPSMLWGSTRKGGARRISPSVPTPSWASASPKMPLRVWRPGLGCFVVGAAAAPQEQALGWRVLLRAGFRRLCPPP